MPSRQQLGTQFLLERLHIRSRTTLRLDALCISHHPTRLSPTEKRCFHNLLEGTSVLRSFYDSPNKKRAFPSESAKGKKKIKKLHEDAARASMLCNRPHGQIASLATNNQVAGIIFVDQIRIHQKEKRIDTGTADCHSIRSIGHSLSICITVWSAPL